MVCRTTKLLTERSPCQMCFLRQQRQQDYCFQLVNCALFLEDNRDNRNNKKNGRNCGMSRGDIQLGQQDYCWQLVFPQAQGLCSWCDEIVRRCRTFFQGFLRCSRRNAPVYFLTTTETTVTTGRTDATTGCHEVTYNWDNKITVGSLFFFASSRALQLV